MGSLSQLVQSLSLARAVFLSSELETAASRDGVFNSLYHARPLKISMLAGRNTLVWQRIAGVSSVRVKKSAIRALDVRPSQSSSEQTGGENSASNLVSIDNESSEEFTVIHVRSRSRPGFLQRLNLTFKDLCLQVFGATIDMEEGGYVSNFFSLTDKQGQKILGVEDQRNIKKALLSILDEDEFVNGNGSVQSRPLTVPSKKVHDLPRSHELKRRTELLYSIGDQYLKEDVRSIQQSIVDHVEYTVARSRFKFDDFEAYQGTAYSVRDRLIERWNDTQHFIREKDVKRVFYLSMEFLMGRSLLNSIFNLRIKDQYAEGLAQLGYNLEVLVEKERDAALGNGGLGRLAACFLDSLATLDYPAWGYGIRYQYGMFRQIIQDGFQHEQPDYWLNFGNPWEIERSYVTYPVQFFGSAEGDWRDGKKHFKWIPGETVEAVAYDNPIPGYNTNTTINLRLWGAKPSGEFDLQSFNTGDYVNAILSKQRAETISSILYPDDRTYQGKELRLKQQHFFVSASLQDVVRRFKDHHKNFDEFPDKIALQLNDTHPLIGVPELMRLLVDVEGVDWNKAWEITTKVFSFTIHTVLPEALEKWPVEILGSVLPRHLQIIYDINFQFIEELKKMVGNDYDRLARMSIVEEGEKKSIRMATLGLVASHAVNGVAEIHSQHLKHCLFKDFYDIWPHKFHNKTNGVTQRRWLAFSNQGLREVISKWLGTESWITNLDLLLGLKEHSSDPILHEQWFQARRQNKKRLAAYIEKLTGLKVSIDAMFDVQVKRIHEYKRQLLNVLGIIHRYDCIKNMSPEDRKRVAPRVCIFGGKAAPGYEIAKLIVKLIHEISKKINSDPDVGHLLKVVFIPDYNVSVAELIIPASDLSQHISLAGNEASGTSNMKFAMNGCIILGTMDGANVEIQDEIGEENMFIFGVKRDQVARLRAERRNFKPPIEFLRVIGMIRSGVFGHQDIFGPLCDTLDGQSGDFYLLGNEFASYLDVQADVDKAYVDRARWLKMSIMSTARSGKFSSDRTIKEFADEVWGVQPVKRPV